MLFFQRIATPVLDIIANLLSSFGEENIMIIILVMIYWAIDKKKGFQIFTSLMLSLTAMQTLKAIVRAPRPFQVHPELIRAERIETDTGYSFPSGHSTGASSFYSSLFLLFSNIFLRIACVLLIIGVPLSRLYLGVHWPLDVIFGTIIGLGITIFLSSAFGKLYENKKALRSVVLPAGTVLAAISLALAILLQLGLVDETAFSDFMKNTAVFAFALIGSAVEITTSDFVPAKKVKGKVLSVIIGLLLITAVQATSMLIPDSIYYIWAFVRYSLIGAMATLIVPRLLIKLDIMKEKKYYQDMFRDVI